MEPEELLEELELDELELEVDALELDELELELLDDELLEDVCPPPQPTVTARHAPRRACCIRARRMVFPLIYSFYEGVA